MSRKHKFNNPIAAYFVSFATVYWIDVFTRQDYFSILEQAVNYCRAEKGIVPKRRDWRQHNKPIELWSNKVIKQKIEYIYKNPVEAGFVTNPIDWKYSNTRNYAEDETVLKIDNEGIILGML